MRRIPLLLLLGLLLMLGAPSVHADSAPLQSIGPTLQPVTSSQVRMASEQIAIRLHPAVAPSPFFPPLQADYDVLFHFVPAADESLTVGFPLRPVPPGRLYPIYPATIQDFALSEAGKALPFERKEVQWEGGQGDWAVWSLDFHQGVARDLEVRYSVPVQAFGKSFSTPLSLYYILRTGSFWAVNIGQADASFAADRPLRQLDVLSDTTPGWKLADGTLHWQWRDLKPDFDLQVSLANFYWLDAEDQLAAALGQSLLSDEALRDVVRGMTMLYGPSLLGEWEPLRGGRLSGEIANDFLPQVMAAAEAALAARPNNYQLGAEYLRLLYDSSVRYGIGGPKLYNRDRMHLYLQKVAVHHEAFSARIPVAVYQATNDAELRTLALHLFDDNLPEHFDSVADADAWVRRTIAQYAEPRPPEQQVIDDLTPLARQRVQAPPPPTPPPSPTPPPTPPPPTLTSRPTLPRRGAWPYAGAAGVLLAAAATGLWLRRRWR